MDNNTAEDLERINHDLLNSLNPEQYAAVTSLDNTLLVLSGAGTGKTKVLTTKIAYIIDNGFALPSSILAVTFSNRAAREMKTRLASIVSYGADDVWLGTFHAICARILRIHADLIGLNKDFTILDTDDQLRIVKQILKEINVDTKFANSIVSKISRWKDKGQYPENVDQKSLEGRIYQIYQDRIRSYASLDFGDLLLCVIELFKTHADILQKYRDKFQYILVDEYQDTNLSQYLWLRMLAPTGKGLCCVGDDDQSIYSWRGAEIGNILRFEHDFPSASVIRLEQNYRSVGHILGAASSLISHNNDRLGKTIWTDGDDGEKILIKRTYNGYDEAQFVVNRIEYLHRTRDVMYGNIAILARAGHQTREFEDRLMVNNIPYKVIGGLKFYDRREIKDVIAYLRIIVQPNDSLAFERIVNVPKRGIGASTVSQIYDVARENNMSLYLATKMMLEHNMLKSSVRSNLQHFVSIIEGMREQDDLTPSQIAEMVLSKTGYIENLRQENTIESRNQIENIRELVTALEDFKSLSEFIEYVTLATEKSDNILNDVVSVMTLHSAKGLEFDAVFLVGWEEGVFPHNLSLQEGNLEEERRLAYVGITRAKKYVCITYAQNRKVYNQWQMNQPSRFLSEIAAQHVINISSM